MQHNNIRLKAFYMSLYHFGLFEWRYKPVSIIILENKIIIKYLGFIKIRNILINDIQDIKILEKQWVNKFVPGQLFFSMNKMNNPIMITYKKDNKPKIDYLVGSEQTKLEFFRCIKEIKANKIIDNNV